MADQSQSTIAQEGRLDLVSSSSQEISSSIEEELNYVLYAPLSTIKKDHSEDDLVGLVTFSVDSNESEGESGRKERNSLPADLELDEDSLTATSEESIPSQTDTDITTDEDVSLDSFSQFADALDTPEQKISEDYYFEGVGTKNGDSTDEPSSSEVKSSENGSTCKSGLEISFERELENGSDVGYEDNDNVVHAFKTADSIDEIEDFKNNKHTVGISAIDDDNSQTEKRRRKVSFKETIVTESIEISRWNAEEKASLFYTGREMYQFRVEYIMEQNESQRRFTDCTPSFVPRGGIRIFFSLYASLVEFFNCHAVAKFCCGGDPSKNVV